MSKQPEALRLADELEAFWGHYSGPEEPHEMNAAAELRRLAAIKQDLLELARSAASMSLHVLPSGKPCLCNRCEMVAAARAAIAKVKGSEA